MYLEFIDESSVYSQLVTIISPIKYYADANTIFEIFAKNGYVVFKPNIYTTFKASEYKNVLRNNHKKAISISSVILVVGGTLGEDSTSELDYAFALGKEYIYYASISKVYEWNNDSYYINPDEEYKVCGDDVYLYKIYKKCSSNIVCNSFQVLIENGTPADLIEFTSFINLLQDERDTKIKIVDISTEDMNDDEISISASPSGINDTVIIYNISETTENPFIKNNIIRYLKRGRRVFSTKPFRTIDDVYNRFARITINSYKAKRAISLYELYL